MKQKFDKDVFLYINNYEIINRDNIKPPLLPDNLDNTIYYWEKLGGYIKCDGYSHNNYYVDGCGENLEEALVHFYLAATMMDKEG